MSNELENLMNQYVEAEMTFNFGATATLKDEARDEMILLSLKIKKEKASEDFF